MLECAACLIFPSLMAYAAVSDLLTMTISNRVSVALIASFIGLSIIFGLDWYAVMFEHLACGLAVLTVTFAFFAFGWIGGGDAKVAAATAVWLGWGELIDYGVVASILGGGLTLAILFCRNHPLPGFLVNSKWAERLHKADNGVPYGIALAVAGLALYPQTAIFLAAA